MKNILMNIISSIGKRIDGPAFIKEFEDSSKLINELEAIAASLKDATIQNDINTDIKFIKAGDQGERNVYYELKNSFIPMLILHNVVIQYEDYKAQMDYILITSKFICILETKKLNGNITINAEGDFVRSFTNQQGKIYKKEGMYSPISQNQRHVRILSNLLLQQKIIKKTPVLSLVVVANPKSIIDYKYAKKEIKDQIIKYDQLTPRIKRMIEENDEVNLSVTSMTDIADYIVKSHVDIESAFISRYKEYLNTDGLIERAVESKLPIEQAVSEVAAAIDEKQDNNMPINSLVKCKEEIREALIKFRLEQSRAENIKAYYIFNNQQMDDLLEKMPSSTEELTKCNGFGPAKVEKYGEKILGILLNKN